MNTGELIRRYRMEKGMKQVELAEKTGILVSTLRQYELGIRNPKIDRVRVIAAALEIPFSYLLGLENEKNREKTLADFSTEEILAEMKRRIEGNYEKGSSKRKCKRKSSIVVEINC